jgi:hypothetical protein
MSKLAVCLTDWLPVWVTLLCILLTGHLSCITWVYIILNGHPIWVALLCVLLPGHLIQVAWFCILLTIHLIWVAIVCILLTSYLICIAWVCVILTGPLYVYYSFFCPSLLYISSTRYTSSTNQFPTQCWNIWHGSSSKTKLYIRSGP